MAEENHVRTCQELLILGSRFEPGTSQIRSRSVNHSTATFGPYLSKTSLEHERDRVRCFACNDIPRNYQFQHWNNAGGVSYKLQGSGAFTFHSPHLYLTGPEGEAVFVNAMSVLSPFLLHALSLISERTVWLYHLTRRNSRKYCNAKTVKNGDKVQSKWTEGRLATAEIPARGAMGRQRNYCSHIVCTSKTSILQHLGQRCRKHA
jgi:hypothetical protein